MSYREPDSSLSANRFITRGAGGLALLGRVDIGLHIKHTYQSMTTYELSYTNPLCTVVGGGGDGECLSVTISVSIP